MNARIVLSWVDFWTVTLMWKNGQNEAEHSTWIQLLTGKTVRNKKVWQKLKEDGDNVSVPRATRWSGERRELLPAAGYSWGSLIRNLIWCILKTKSGCRLEHIREIESPSGCEKWYSGILHWDIIQRSSLPQSGTTLAVSVGRDRRQCKNAFISSPN